MQGELPIPRNLLGNRRAATSAMPGQRVTRNAPRSWLGLVTFVLMVALCLFDMNSVAYNLFGVNQVFSNVILVLCIASLLIYRFNVIQALGPSGWIFVGFLAMFLMVGVPVGLNTDAASLLNRWGEVRLLLAGLLIVLAASVAARQILLSFGPQFTLRLLFLLSLAIPTAVWVSSYFPDFYRVEIGQERDDERASGTFTNPNEAAAAVCIVAALALSLMTFERSKVFSIGGIAICAYAILLTGSRGGFVMFALLALSQIIISPGYKKGLLFTIGILAVGGMLYGIYNIATVSDTASRTTIRRMEQLSRIAQGEVTDETTGGRFELAMNGLSAWAESPLLGNGLGSQRRVGAANIGPHNSFIRIGGEGGVIPLLLFLLMIASLFWCGWNCTEPAIRTMVLGYTIVLTLTCMMSHNILSSREHNLVLGVVFGLLAAATEMRSARSAPVGRPARRTMPMQGQPVIQSVPRPRLGGS